MLSSVNLPRIPLRKPERSYSLLSVGTDCFVRQVPVLLLPCHGGVALARLGVRSLSVVPLEHTAAAAEASYLTTRLRLAPRMTAAEWAMEVVLVQVVRSGTTVRSFPVVDGSDVNLTRELQVLMAPRTFEVL